MDRAQAFATGIILQTFGISTLVIKAVHDLQVLGDACVSDVGFGPQPTAKICRSSRRTVPIGSYSSGLTPCELSSSLVPLA